LEIREGKRGHRGKIKEMAFPSGLEGAFLGRGSGAKNTKEPLRPGDKSMVFPYCKSFENLLLSDKLVKSRAWGGVFFRGLSKGWLEAQTGSHTAGVGLTGFKMRRIPRHHLAEFTKKPGIHPAHFWLRYRPGFKMTLKPGPAKKLLSFW
jgi:hypothetical protein